MNRLNTALKHSGNICILIFLYLTRINKLTSTCFCTLLLYVSGEPFINGEAVPYDPKYHEEWVKNNNRANQSSRRNDMPQL
jgi:hypothetical protein